VRRAASLVESGPAVGFERPGRIITAAAAAAAFFCIAVGAVATSQIVIGKEIGIALAVLIDASIVRALLVPSLMAILGRWSWWPSSRTLRDAVPFLPRRIRSAVEPALVLGPAVSVERRRPDPVEASGQGWRGATAALVRCPPGVGGMCAGAF
jgi:hypothetical protein